MAVKDIRSNLQQFHQGVTITASAVNTNAIDTADYDLGYMVAVHVRDYVSGDATIVIQESDDGTTGWTDISSDQLIGSYSDIDFTQNTGSTTPLPRLGVFSNKRYLRTSITGTGGADMNVEVITTLAAEQLPVS